MVSVCAAVEANNGVLAGESKVDVKNDVPITVGGSFPL